VAALAVHLVSAGGVQPAAIPRAAPNVVAAPAPTPAPAPTVSPVAPTPQVTVKARPVSRPPAPRVTPVPTPMPLGAVSLPDVETPPAPLSVPRTAEKSRVYSEDEVDVRPRRLAGTTAPYPDWGPKLPKGRRVSITASYVVTEEGLVTDIRVERGGGVLEAVLLEMSRWKFEPGMIHGMPVKVRLQWKHTFIGG
jgi:outer membrane biosynthesis protein TonB